MINDNKNSYFKVELTLPEFSILDDEIYNRQVILLENKMDEIFNRIGTEDDIYLITKKNEKNLLYLFRTTRRKRIGLIRNLLEKKIDNEIQKDCGPLKKSNFYRVIEELKKNPQYTVRHEDSEYKGKDVKIFNDRKNWFKWQEDLYNTIFDKNGNFKKASDREIIFIKCPEGNTGKSTFVKWLFLQHPQNIGFITEGTEAQIKSAVTNQDKKKCYFIDLPRTRTSKNSTLGLMNATETVKTGIITKVMFGSGKTMVMENPWIIMLGNFLPLGGFTPDRWKVFEINSKKELVDITREARQLAKDKILIDQYDQKAEIKEIKERAKFIKSKMAK
jgi:hypothetical protein